MKKFNKKFAILMALILSVSAVMIPSAIFADGARPSTAPNTIISASRKENVLEILFFILLLLPLEVYLGMVVVPLALDRLVQKGGGGLGQDLLE